jgi:hypothetical protein
MPEQDVVLAITSGSGDMQGILNVVWKYLLPAMEESSLPPDQEGVEQLKEKLVGMAIRTVEGDESSSRASEVSGKIYTVEPNDRSIQTISFNFEAPDTEITITTNQGEHTFVVGYQEMVTGTLANPSLVSEKVAVSGAWETADTYTVKIIYYETPQSVKFTFRFEENKLFWDTENRASFGPENPLQLTGTK